MSAKTMREQIFEMFDEGLTVDEVVKETGNKKNTIQTYKSWWNKERQEGRITKVAETLKTEAPKEKTDDFKALEEENKSLMRRISELRDVNRKAGDESQKLTDKVNKLQDENESLEAQLNVLKQDFKTLNDDYTKKSDMLNESADENDELKSKLKEFDDMKRHIELLRQELELKNESLKAYKSERDYALELHHKEHQKLNHLYKFIVLEKEVM